MTPREGNPTRQIARVALRLVQRMLVWGGLMAAVTLFYWSRIDDPRFYRFLETDAGATMARIFGWYASPLERPPADKTDGQMTAVERSVKLKLEELLRAQGTEGDLQVTYRDVAFCREIPRMTAHVAPPYLILTDSPVDDVPSHVQALARAYEGFQRQFGPLTTSAGRGQLSHVLLFSDPADYRAYQQRYAAGLENTAGFYSPIIDRLVLYQHPHEDPVDEHSETLHTVRHEGAHQFLYAHGVHSGHRVENDWLVEGLATYLEGAEAGAVAPFRAGMVARALQRQGAIPLDEFVGRRQEDGLLAYKPAELAYSEAWTLVHFLMQQERREAFFAYIAYVRDAGNFRAVRKQPRIRILSAFLGISPTELQEQWENYVRKLAAGGEHRGYSPYNPHPRGETARNQGMHVPHDMPGPSA